MYCPKCKETFAEGSRRFCPTDGARLVSNTLGKSRPAGGIFANLIPKLEADSRFDERLSNIPTIAVSEPKPRSEGKANTRKADADAVYPATDELIETEKFNTDNIGAPRSTRSPKKISSGEIPAGHVELKDELLPLEIFREFEIEDPEDFVGQLIKGRYKVVSFFGGDESRLAYLAEDSLIENKKVLLRILIEDEYDEIMGSILAEERVSLSHLTHPNIARLIDSGQFADGTTFLVNEYVDALSVKDIVTIHGHFDPVRTAVVIKQAANALNAVHQEGILHRDLRPENLIILRGRRGTEQSKIVNFGASSGGLTTYNLAYKAPEVLDGRIATISSDIFSLAIIAFQMLTGRMPFEGSTKKEIFRSQTEGLLIMPSEIRPELSKSIDVVMDRALALNAAERYPHARDFGEAFYAALTESSQSTLESKPSRLINDSSGVAGLEAKSLNSEQFLADNFVVSKPAASANPVIPTSEEPAWKMRSPEPPEIGYSKIKIFGGLALVAVALLTLGWYYWSFNQPNPDTDQQAQQIGGVGNLEKSNTKLISNTEMPPLSRNIPQPPNTSYYQNSKQNLSGDLLRNFVGFTVYYPKDWKVNGPQAGTTSDSRGKFLDISRATTDGRLKEQMLVSYYSSKGTFDDDRERFPQLVRETNEVLKSLLPEYVMVSEGEIKINGEWKAYEIKFQGSGTSASGEKLVVWGRRLFMPAARHGVRNGFEITLLATSLAEEVSGVNDVGVRGELAAILYSFEPSQNF